MTIFEVLLNPFIFIIKQLFLFGYSITNNYGWAIILLSFFISVLLLPIFIFIEKAKKKDDAIKLKMKPLIDEIKRCYKGQERYYYLKTINRQHNYSPTQALIPILSLLIQIPFFIAAYQFLEGFEPLAGVSFTFIKDLNEPDGLLGAINILPIAMTLVNLITAYFYTKNGDPKERKQMAVVAGIFLILLFNLPSGLVLYWTMNNVFSFFRLFITNPEVFKTNSSHKKRAIPLTSYFRSNLILLIPRLKSAFIFFSLIFILSQLNWAINNSFDDITIRVLISIAISFIITLLIGTTILILKQYKSHILEIKLLPKFYYPLFFVAIYFYLAGIFYFTGINSTLINIATATTVPLQFIGIIYVIRQSKIITPFLRILTTFLLLFILITQLLNLVAFINGKEILLIFLNIKIVVQNNGLSSFVFSGILFSLITLPYYAKQHPIKNQVIEYSNWLIYFLSVFYISGLLFFWNPLIVYSSSPETFDFVGVEILSENYILFFITLITSLFIYFVTPKKIKKILLFFSILLTIIALINSFIVPLNLGSLQESRFSEQEKLAAPLYYYIIESVLLIAVFRGVLWILKKQYKQVIIGTLIFINILLFGSSVYKTSKTGFLLNSEKPYENNGKVLSLSKSEKNIIYFIADGFQGWFIKQIIDKNPKLKNTYSGFTWYPNTISESNYTHSSIPALLGGINHSVSKMNSDSVHTIKEKITSVSTQFYKKAQSIGYKYTATNMHYANINSSKFDGFIPKWDNKWNKQFSKMNLDESSEMWFTRLYENAMFFSVPLFLKPQIYNNKEWLSYYKKEKPKNVSLKKYNFIRLLPYLSNANSQSANFIYIHDKTAHNPWNILTKNGHIIKDVSPYENNEWFIKQFGLWIKWMKANDVYDNTKIVIVSDHGVAWNQYDGEMNIEAPIKWDKNDPNKITKEFFWRLNALLLVKDFNSTGDIIEDWRLMSNADAYNITFNDNYLNERKDSGNRVVKTYFTRWESHMIQQNTMKIYKQFEIKNNIFDLTNWKKISN